MSQSHQEREREVLENLETAFPDFTGVPRAWVSVAQGADPPDFVSRGPAPTVGLELTEWLDGEQMEMAKAKEVRRAQIQTILTKDWQNSWQPQNIRAVFPSPRYEGRINPSEEKSLRDEFFARVKSLDSETASNIRGWGPAHRQTEFDGFPLLNKYFSSINCVHGGAFDPNLPAQSLERSLAEKLNAYSHPDKRAHLAKHGLAELNLLLHADYKHTWYNTPWGHQTTLGEIAASSADYYSHQPHRNTFDHVWLFYSIDFAEDLSELVGISEGLQKFRWMAQLWPTFHVFREAAEKPPVL